ncbi:MAG: hydrolase [Verrucomicrobia bacterium]|nr:MAG: hydrolase [Verrucomicrobiota bacterium]
MKVMDLKSIPELKSFCQKNPWQGKLYAQVESLRRKDSANGKPYWELGIRDAEGSMTLRAWSDGLAFSQCSSILVCAVVEITGEFFCNGQYGLDARRWEVRTLSKEESQYFFQGKFATDEDFNWIQQTVARLEDPRLRELALLFLKEFGSRFCRAAAARKIHHAYRGGLCRHTAQMMRMADQTVSIYPHLNRDLLITGALFHDCGKLWEVCPPEQGFLIPHDMRGELMGHISIGIELINTLWRKLPLESWKEISPASEDVRLHLIHLVAAHHGEYGFGSPVCPKTPEALALHFIDNLDAKLEMIKEAYATSHEVGSGVFEKHHTLNVMPIFPLPPLSN